MSNTIENKAVIAAVTLASKSNGLEGDELFNTVRNELKISFSNVPAAIKTVLREQKLILGADEKHDLIMKTIADNGCNGFHDSADAGHFESYTALWGFVELADSRLTKRDVTSTIRREFNKEFKAPKKPARAELTGFELLLNEIFAGDWLTITDAQVKELCKKYLTRGSAYSDALAIIQLMKTNGYKKQMQPIQRVNG